MTSTVTNAITSAITTLTYNTLSTTVGIIAIVLLIVLLVQRELVCAVGTARAAARVQALDIAIAPLLLAFVVIVTVRLAYLLHLLHG